MLTILKGLVVVSGDDGRVVKEIEDATSLFGQDDLFLSSLNCGGEMDVVGFLELLASLYSSVPRAET